MNIGNATPKRFLGLCERLEIPDATATVAFDMIVKSYSESNRIYHNLGHVDVMLGDFDRICPEDAGIEMAIWFHDIIYDPRAGDNETRSAELFVKLLGQLAKPATVVNVVRLILATDYSRERSGQPDEDLMRDIDVSILAASPKHYAAYAQAIREEYSHVTDQDFARGRSRILASFLGRQTFHSAELSSREQRARANIQAELATLAGTP